MEKMELDDNVVDLSVSTTSLTPPSSPVGHQQASPMSRRLRKFKDLTVTKQRQSRNSPHPKTSYQSKSKVLRTAKSPFKFKIPAVPKATNLSKHKSPPCPIISRVKLLAFPRADTLRFSCPVSYSQRKFKSVAIPDIELTKSFITTKSNDPLIVSPKLQHGCLYVKRAEDNNQVSNVKKRRCLLKARKLKTDLTCTDCVCHSSNVRIITDCSSLSKAENDCSANESFMSLSDLSRTNGCLANHIISLNCGTKLKLNFLSQSKAINVKDVVLNHRTIVTDQDLRRNEIVDNEVGYMMDIEEIEIGVDSESAFSSEGSTGTRKEACPIARRDPALTITPATARDLRALSGLTITPAPPPMATMSIEHTSTGRRVLRPRTEPRSYTESPDIVLLPGRALNGNSRLMIQANGNYDSDSDEGEMPPLYPIKELSAAEIWERERCLRKLREELRGEETKLVLLKKLKQSQQLKENIAVVPPPSSAVQQAAASPLLSAKNSLTALSQLGSSLSVTPALPPQPQPAHSRSGKPAAILRGQPPPARSGALPAPRSSLPGGATLTPGPAHRTSLGRQPNLTITPSVTITPTSAPPASKTKPSLVGQSESPCKVMPGSGGVTITPAPAPVSEQSTERTRDDGQTPAQRQAAAKLALRKQLEKTLLQIPPPKPPPPEMHFIPNPSNTEFVYLLGLEHVVDFITKERKGPPAPEPFRCQQCRSDFTPVWKWEKQSKHRPANATFQNPQGKDPRVICEQCVTSNVKKALKAEHTNRLKTAFVKALQQEQEIEQRMANQNSSPAPHEPAPPPPPPPVTPKAATPTPIQRHAPTPPTQPTPPPSSSSRSSRGHDNSVEKNAFAHLGGLGNASASAAAMQALQQQLFRGLSQAGALAGAPPHMLPFSPLFYPYQLAMAQAAGLGKGGGGNLADLQRAADLQRQYLLDMIPPQNPGQTSQRQGNWKT